MGSSCAKLVIRKQNELYFIDVQCWATKTIFLVSLAGTSMPEQNRKGIHNNNNKRRDHWTNNSNVLQQPKSISISSQSALITINLFMRQTLDSKSAIRHCHRLKLQQRERNAADVESSVSCQSSIYCANKHMPWTDSMARTTCRRRRTGFHATKWKITWFIRDFCFECDGYGWDDDVAADSGITSWLGGKIVEWICGNVISNKMPLVELRST